MQTYSLVGRPYLRILIPFVLGILLAHYFTIPSNLFWLLVPLFITLLFFGAKKYKTQYNRVFGLLFFSFLLIASASISLKSDIYSFENKDYFIKGIIKSEAKTSNWTRFELEIVQADALEISPTKVQCYVQDKSNFAYGDTILAKANILPLKRNTNPYSFDYTLYLNKKRIHHQVFLKEGTWLQFPNQSFSFLKTAQDIRQSYLKQMRQTLGETESYTVLAALLFGYKTDLEQETRTLYADTGAMHVLAVSGLHVGLIYVFLVWLVKLLPFQHRKAELIKTLSIILGLWAFGLLTGLPASVQRSCTMFSFIAFGQWMNNRPDIYNSIAASAFFLLLLDSQLLFDTGFQLSYLALTGIVYFQDWIFRSLYFKNKILRYVWGLISVSLAAQLTVTPISLYYFNQFPSYFWLSGIVVVPIASIVLIGGVIYCISLPISSIVADFLLKILATIIDFQNLLLAQIQYLPFAKLSNIHLSFGLLILLYLAILLFMFFKKMKVKSWLWGSLAVFLLGASFYSFKNIEKQANNCIVFYDDYKQHTIDFKIGNQVYRSFKGDSLENNFHCKGFESYYGIDSIFYLKQAFENASIHYKYPFVQAKDKLGLIIYKEQKIRLQNLPKQLDFLFLDIYPNEEEWLKILESQAKFILFSNRIDLKYWKWNTDSLESIKLHFIRSDGAKILYLK